jgi:hypothetical protein
MEWKKNEGSPEMHDYRREGGWSVHLKVESPPLWVLCDSGGNRRGEKAGLKPEDIAKVCAWADDTIAGKPSDEPNLRWVHASKLH